LDAGRTRSAEQGRAGRGRSRGWKRKLGPCEGCKQLQCFGGGGCGCGGLLYGEAGQYNKHFGLANGTGDHQQVPVRLNCSPGGCGLKQRCSRASSAAAACKHTNNERTAGETRPVGVLDGDGDGAGGAYGGRRGRGAAMMRICTCTGHGRWCGKSSFATPLTCAITIRAQYRVA
jgi:hypothetical protein